MSAKHRPALAAPTDGWKRQHNDSYYRTAIEKSQPQVSEKPKE